MNNETRQNIVFFVMLAMTGGLVWWGDYVKRDEFKSKAAELIDGAFALGRREGRIDARVELQQERSAHHKSIIREKLLEEKVDRLQQSISGYKDKAEAYAIHDQQLGEEIAIHKAEIDKANGRTEVIEKSYDGIRVYVLALLDRLQALNQEIPELPKELAKGSPGAESIKPAKKPWFTKEGDSLTPPKNP